MVVIVTVVIFVVVIVTVVLILLILLHSTVREATFIPEDSAAVIVNPLTNVTPQ